MTLYTVVEEDYTVSIYRTAKLVCQHHANYYCFENTDFLEEEPVAATADDIAKKLRKEEEVRLYPLTGGDWKCKIAKHNRTLG